MTRTITTTVIADMLHDALDGAKYHGSLSRHISSAIEQHRTNYSFENLMQYCRDMGVAFSIMDMNTEDSFPVCSSLEAHKVIRLLMDRYNVNEKIIYKRVPVLYTAPKSYDAKELERMRQADPRKRNMAPLSIYTFLAVCAALHCVPIFQPKQT